MEIFRRIWFLLNRRKRERELAEEMEAHRELMSPEDRAAFGNALALREEASDSWGWRWLDDLWRDLAYGVRILRRSPGFTLAAVATLALGIGVSLSAFQLLNTLVLRPLPLRGAERIYQLDRRAPGFASDSIAYPAMVFFRENSQAFEALFAQADSELEFEGEAMRRLQARFVSANYFAQLGAGAAAGQLFGPREAEVRSSEPVAVLGHAFWQSQYGSDPEIVGKTIRLHQRPVVVAGVLAKEFSGLQPTATDVWIPLAHYPRIVQSGDPPGFETNIQMFGRLATGRTIETALESLKPLTAELRTRYPEQIRERERVGARPAGYASHLTRRDVPMVAFFGSLVLLVLAVAGSNFGSLLLARAMAREREFGIRASLGAGRARVFRQLLTESLLLCAAGAGLGLMLSLAGGRLLLWSVDMPQSMDTVIDWRTGGVALGLAFLVALIFGSAPAMHAALRRKRPERARMAMVGAQVAATCALLIVAGLHARSLQRVFSEGPGFDYRNVVAVVPPGGFQSEEVARRAEELKRKAAGIQGIEAAAICGVTPLSFSAWSENAGEPGRRIDAYVNAVEPSYFGAMQIPILLGRKFTAGERDVVMVSESLARKRWPGESAVGKRYKTGSNVVVVGVVGNARTQALRDGEAVEVYYPHREQGARLPAGGVVIRTAIPPARMIPILRAALEDPKTAPLRYTPLESAFEETTEGSRKGMIGVSIAGALALLLAATGIGGLLAFTVLRRTREIAVRVALGAPRVSVASLVLRQMMRPVCLGLACGLAGGAGLAGLMRSQLYGLGRFDPASYVAAVAVLLAASALAAAIPVRRALALDPNAALKHE